MKPQTRKLVSLIIPVYNEEENLLPLYEELKKVTIKTPYTYEIIFVNDGSTDSSAKVIETLSRHNPKMRYIEFSRNFGKEMATTAGLHACEGDAAIVLDADLQHPIHLIPEFLAKWQGGAEVVIGVRKRSMSDGIVKKVGSYWFYKIMNLVSEVKMVPQATDFRLLDRAVITEFNRLTERGRITRGLIDWLGFKREYIQFNANQRAYGKPRYNTFKLINLAFISFISLSLLPLRLAGYLGVIIVLVSGSLGIIMILDRYIISDWLYFSGPAILADVILFLVGIILICLGILAFYIGNIHREAQNRPMYVVRRKSIKSKTL